MRYKNELIRYAMGGDKVKGSPGKAPAFQFYVKDWLSDPQLRLTSPATRGIWIDLLCFMWSSNNRGVLKLTKEQIGKLTGANDSEIETFFIEAENFQFCDIFVTSNGTSQICNRRMSREHKTRENNRLRQKKHREKLTRNTPVTEQKGGAPSPSPIPSPTAKTNNSNKLLLCQIAKSFNEILPELNPVKITNNIIENETIRTQLKTRIKQRAEYKDPKWWRDFFQSIRKMPWLMGDNDRDWIADLMWITKKMNFDKILSGRYTPRQRDEVWRMQ